MLSHEAASSVFSSTFGGVSMSYNASSIYEIAGCDCAAISPCCSSPSRVSHHFCPTGLQAFTGHGCDHDISGLYHRVLVVTNKFMSSTLSREPTCISNAIIYSAVSVGALGTSGTGQVSNLIDLDNYININYSGNCSINDDNN